jgi:hypothetical protein
MKRLVNSFCFVLIFAFVATSIQAQAKQAGAKPKPDFSGAWQLDTAKSNVGPSVTPDQPLKITHHDPEFRITRMIGSNGQLSAHDFVYYSDGRGEKNPTLVFLSTRNDTNPQSHDKDATKSKTTWSGTKLVTRSTVRSLIGGQVLEFEIIDEWKLFSDGKTLTQTSRTVFRQDNSGAIFVPANRPDMKRVYNRVPD